ncbi:MAG: metal ABC transporter solute-binding protein, Zn/Mn family [Planctomycetota bacterium]
MRSLLAFLPLALLACSEGGATSRRPGEVRVLATTGMVADLARVIGGDRVAVDALMGAGVDPHLYKASAGDLDRLRAADLVLCNGCMLEGKMQDQLLKLGRNKPVVAVTESVAPERLLEPPELSGHYDPHVWFDVALWSETTAAVAGALAGVDPAHAAEYEERGARYRAELLELHKEVKEAIAAIQKERRVLITSHDAFRYFGRAYDIEVMGLQGISTVSEAGVQDVQRIVETVVSRRVKAIFIETSVSPKNIEAVQVAAREKGHEVKIGGTLYSDAMGDRPPEDTYVGMVRANVRTLVEALR